jgi:hypothetical protein
MKNNLLFAVLLSVAAAGTASAQLLTQVPMQGGMLMPTVAYNAASGAISVAMPAEVPQLTPLLVSDPTKWFDSSVPWFSALDPVAQGLAFSRRYGFDMAKVTDPLPANTQIWIRKLSGPTDLKFYNCLASPPTFAPVFGTDGASNAVYWNAVMWHPCVAAPPGTNSYTATFEVYLVDTTTGKEVAGSSSGPLVFNWTDVSDGRPTLNLAQKIMVAWPSATTTNWVLEAAPGLDATNWIAVTNAPVSVDGQPCVILDRNVGLQFFRMRYLP